MSRVAYRLRRHQWTPEQRTVLITVVAVLMASLLKLLHERPARDIDRHPDTARPTLGVTLEDLDVSDDVRKATRQRTRAGAKAGAP